MFLDTDVLIWGLKQNVNAIQRLDELDEIQVSAVVFMELLQCARNKPEQRIIETALDELGAAIMPLNEDISTQATSLVKQFALSHSLYMADALIAATALYHQMPLMTGNDKHFGIVPGLTLDVFRPSSYSV